MMSLTVGALTQGRYTMISVDWHDLLTHVLFHIWINLMWTNDLELEFFNRQNEQGSQIHQSNDILNKNPS